MKKQIDFNSAKEARLDEQIKKTMQRDFPLPDCVDAAKNTAFAQIRNKQMKQEYANGVAQKQKDKRRLRSAFVRGAGGLAAAAAVFSVVCISNPALAANIPLVGHIFEEIGSSLGFSGNYSKYVQPLTEENLIAASEVSESETVSETDGDAAAPVSDSAYSKTVNGVTMTLSEVYCNDAALYLSLLIESEDVFPETFTDQMGKQSLNLYDSYGEFSYNSEKIYLSNYLDGKFVDDHTYAAVLRIDLQETNTGMEREKFEDAKKEFVAELLGMSIEEVEKDTDAAYEKAAEALGQEVLYDNLSDVGGPSFMDYLTEISIPEEFTVNLDIPMIVGTLPQDQQTRPEMPQELLDEYHAGLVENGLGDMVNDMDVYKNFTDEQKQIEHELFTQMHRKYNEMYPEAAQYPSKYENWWLDGPWNFEISVKRNHEDSVVKEINDIDENGLGVVSVTKTPFEITVETQEPDISQSPSGAGYFVVALDADGEIMPYGSGGRINVWAIQDRDISRVDIYLCDYIEYLDELKVYYWSDTYETDKETKTFKQLLDERALYHTEVTFEEQAE
ncbi:MAG: DUF4179 domain-containing protein [Eubacteriales bacterium]|nr:DUF4179 domain-containing protein [Eubacteriales bacterium]